MIQTIATNEKNDIFLDANGNISLIYEIDAVLQACEHAVKAQFDEMIFSSTSGVPSFQTIWRGGEPNIAQYDAALRRAILSVPDVLEIRSLDIIVEENTFKYEATINTVYGISLFSGIGAQ